MVIIGVFWLAMAKGKVMSSEDEKFMTEEDRSYYKVLSICCALMSAVLGSMRIQQGKYVFKKLKYSPMDFSIDAGLFLGFIIFLISVYYYLIGHPSYTWYNFGVCFIASIFQMITAMVGLNAITRGLGGPTTAILQTQAVLGIIMNAIFLGFIPTLMQVFGSIIAFGGVATMLIFNK